MSKNVKVFSQKYISSNKRHSCKHTVSDLSVHPGAFYLAKQLMSLLDLLLDSDGPLQLGQPEAIPPW